MARILVSQHAEDSQVLRTDNRKKFVVNCTPDWQFLFGPDSMLSNSVQILKIAAELDPDCMDSIRFAGYLYNPVTGSVDNAATCVFNIYKVVKAGWQEELIFAVPGAIQSNQYFYAEKQLTDFSPACMDGGVTLMIEAVIVRSGEIYRERVYINHLGIYETAFRTDRKVDYLDITKADI